MSSWIVIDNYYLYMNDIGLFLTGLGLLWGIYIYIKQNNDKHLNSIKSLDAQLDVVTSWFSRNEGEWMKMSEREKLSWADPGYNVFIPSSVVLEDISKRDGVHLLSQNLLQALAGLNQVILSISQIEERREALIINNYKESQKIELFFEKDLRESEKNIDNLMSYLLAKNKDINADNNKDLMDIPKLAKDLYSLNRSIHEDLIGEPSKKGRGSYYYGVLVAELKKEKIRSRKNPTIPILFGFFAFIAIEVIYILIEKYTNLSNSIIFMHLTLLFFCLISSWLVSYIRRGTILGLK